ncbi:sucrose synthase [Ranunculus cassubicifolius]
MEKVTRPRMLTRTPCFDKRTDTILIAARERLLTFLTEVKMRGVGIVEPQHISEYVSAVMNESATELRNEDFREILRAIREAVVLAFGVAFALNLGEEDWEYILVKDDSLDVETLVHSDYSYYRWKSMNGSEEAGEALLHVNEPTPLVKQDSGILRVKPQSKSQGSTSGRKIMKH